MKQTKVVRMKDLPSRLPLNSSCIAYLLLDRFQAPEWLWGATGVLAALIWSASVIAMCKETHTAIFEDE